MVDTIEEAASACLYHSVPTRISCNTECISTVLFKIILTNCCPHILMMSGEGDVCVDNDPMWRGGREAMPLLKNVDVLSKLDAGMKLVDPQITS